MDNGNLNLSDLSSVEAIKLVNIWQANYGLHMTQDIEKMQKKKDLDEAERAYLTGFADAMLTVCDFTTALLKSEVPVKAVLMMALENDLYAKSNRTNSTQESSSETAERNQGNRGAFNPEGEVVRA